jgi:hypothetical protein
MPEGMCLCVEAPPIAARSVASHARSPSRHPPTFAGDAFHEGLHLDIPLSRFQLNYDRISCPHTEAHMPASPDELEPIGCSPLQR